VRRLSAAWPRVPATLQAVAAVTAVVSVATMFDELHRLLELFAHFRLQYLVASALLTVAFAILRRYSWLALMAATTLLNLWPVAPWYVATAAARAATDTPLKLLTANVEGENEDTERLIDLVRSQAPDLVFLQEVTGHWAAAIEALGAAYPYRHVVARDDHFGIAVLSRLPLLRIETMQSPPLGLPSLLVELDLHGRNVTFINTHAMPPIGRFGYEARNRQLLDMAATVLSIDGPVVLAGDMNTTMWGNHYRQFIATTGLRNARQGFGVVPSWPTTLPFAMIPIDQCLVSADFAVLDMRSGPRFGSDHLPLIISIALGPADRESRMPAD
jgi:endonuclease/exonuclease/phosphatase (EEP) superfamily protein YafD